MVETFILCGSCFADCAILSLLVYDCSATGL
jgi:hypothetical protein